MSFLQVLDTLPIDRWRALTDNATDADVQRALDRQVRSPEDFAVLLSPAAGNRLEDLARHAQRLTQQRFGKTIQLFAPLYVSNECANVCTYCGFSQHLKIARKTLSAAELRREAGQLTKEGFRHLLLVSGEHAKHVSVDYLEQAVKTVRPMASSLAIEVAPLSEPEYKRLVQAGVDGLIVYQETYDKQAYAAHHPKGKKRDYASRLETPERGARAGMRRIGIGALLGLGDARGDLLSLAAHARYLLQHHWQSVVTVSLPRLRPAAGGFRPEAAISDATFVQWICALRLALPDVGIVLSTRESHALRDGLMRVGVTQMSAGSRTEPGGYTMPSEAEEQFEIEDTRSAGEVAGVIAAQGYEPVWKDWEESLHG